MKASFSGDIHLVQSLNSEMPNSNKPTNTNLFYGVVDGKNAETNEKVDAASSKFIF